MGTKFQFHNIKRVIGMDGDDNYTKLGVCLIKWKSLSAFTKTQVLWKRYK